MLTSIKHKGYHAALFMGISILYLFSPTTYGGCAPMPGGLISTMYCSCGDPNNNQTPLEAGYTGVRSEGACGNICGGMFQIHDYWTACNNGTKWVWTPH